MPHEHANCCSALQCVAVRCSALQCVAVRCSALQYVAARCSALQYVAVRGSALQCVAVRCTLIVHPEHTTDQYPQCRTNTHTAPFYWRS